MLFLMPCRLQYISVTTSAGLGTMISWMGLGKCLPPLHQAVCCYLRIWLGVLNADHICKFVKCIREKE